MQKKKQLEIVLSVIISQFTTQTSNSSLFSSIFFGKIVLLLKLEQQTPVKMKQSRSCHTCQRHFFNLMNATCGHKICFHCVKSNRNSNKCSECITQSQHRPRSSFISPNKINNELKQPSTRIKDSESKLLSQHSHLPLHRSRQSFHRSQINYGENESENAALPSIKCKQHHEPLTMFSKSSKELICSVCVCLKTKLNGDVVPLRQAEQLLKRENILNKEESKVILGNIEHAQRIMNKNTQIFENSYKSGLKSLQLIFQQLKNQVLALEQKLKQQFMSFFKNKFKQCDEITQDLNYLCSILKEYRDNNKEKLNFKELIYMFTSFKLIKGTIKNLDLDYIPYLRDINLVEINKNDYKDPLHGFVKLKLNLPLKFTENKKSKCKSNKSVSRSKNQQWDQIYRGMYTQGKLDKNQRTSIAKKHQMSLCSNVHGIEMGEEEKNLYKMLLKTKFKL